MTHIIEAGDEGLFPFNVSTDKIYLTNKSQIKVDDTVIIQYANRDESVKVVSFVYHPSCLKKGYSMLVLTEKESLS